MPQFQMTQWVLLLLFGGIGSLAGILLSYFFPGGFVREFKYKWHPYLALLQGIIFGELIGFVSGRPALAMLALPIAYFTSRLPSFGAASSQAGESEETPKFFPERMPLRKGWNSRPRYEEGDAGQFVGRKEFVERLSIHFSSKGGGTILISGVRGVGKTALVDRALVSARQELTNLYWEQNYDYLLQVPRWHLVDRLVRRTIPRFRDKSLRSVPEDFTNRPTPNFGLPILWRINPVQRRIRRMYQASNWQLFVLKFSAADISGALAEPGQDSTGKLRIDPEKLLRSVIRKLYLTCVADHKPEAKILQWSLSKKRRKRFFDTLAAAYNKSISKSYKEIITNSLNDLMKRSQSSALEGKMSLERVVLLLACVAIGVGGFFVSSKLNFGLLRSYIAGGVPAVVALYFVATWTFKRSRESSTDSARQAQTSYEYDYSLEQMQSDLEELLSVFKSPDREPFDPSRCFTRSVIVFDELDKLENADQQLDDVITHFKNFFTLSHAVFVFLTDHEFYEYLSRETAKARLARHYPPQHTFFTEKIYLRKPEFSLFREAFFRFAEDEWLSQRSRSLPPDPVLIDYLLHLDEESDSVIESLPLSALTQLYINRALYKRKQTEAIEREFEKQQVFLTPFMFAQVWTSQVISNADVKILEEARTAFENAQGWNNPEAVALLYFWRERFGPDYQKKIDDHYEDLKSPNLTLHTTVDQAPFTLSDLARAICFQTRNHYFDLYNNVYDYVGSYSKGSPVLYLDDSSFTQESRLSSRYQQLIEIAFDSIKERHSSFEYFNALLMETLYRVFDKRVAGSKVLVAELLFSANPAPPAKKPRAKAASQANGEVTAFTLRDAEKIDKAVIRLLRLALAHNIIGPFSADFAAKLNNDALKPSELKDLIFYWNDNSFSIISTASREAVQSVRDTEEYEKELIDFWDKSKEELDAIDVQLTQLWSGLDLPDEAKRLQAVIGELRSKAEGLRLKSIKISRPDATALQSHVGTRELRESVLWRMALERIRAEDDADILEESRSAKGDKLVKVQLENRKRDFETKTSLRLNAIICPRGTDLTIYFVASQVPPDFKLEPLEAHLSKGYSYLFYFALGKIPPEVPSSSMIQFYASPPSRASATSMFSYYLQISGRARLNQTLAHLKTSNYTDANLAMRAGAEILGPVTGESEVRKVLEGPLTLAAISSLVELKERFIETPAEALRYYGLSPTAELSRAEAIDELSARMARSITAYDNFGDLLKTAMGDLFLKAAPPKFSVDGWIRVFLSLPPNGLEASVLTQLLKPVLSKRIKDLQIEEQAEAAIITAFVPEFVRWIVQLPWIVPLPREKENVLQLLASPNLYVELEKLRRQLRATPLPPIMSVLPQQFSPKKRARGRNLLSKK